jgi:hypothetical protein
VERERRGAREEEEPDPERQQGEARADHEDAFEGGGPEVLAAALDANLHVLSVEPAEDGQEHDQASYHDAGHREHRHAERVGRGLHLRADVQRRQRHPHPQHEAPDEHDRHHQGGALATLDEVPHRGRSYRKPSPPERRLNASRSQ